MENRKQCWLHIRREGDALHRGLSYISSLSYKKYYKALCRERWRFCRNYESKYIFRHSCYIQSSNITKL